MALTKIQGPAEIGKNWITSIKDTFFVASSSQLTQPKMRYKFSLIDVNGEIINSKNPPLIKGGIGVFNPTNILKDLLSFKFQPEITTITKADGGIIQYQVKCEEFNTTSPTSQTFKKVMMLNAVDQDFNYVDYTLSGPNKNLLTKYKSLKKVRMDDRHTFRCFAGKLIPIGEDMPVGSDISNFYEIKLEVTKPNGNIYNYTSLIFNPFIGNTNKYGLTSNANPPQDVSEWLFDFPSGPHNINNMKWRLRGFTPFGGSYITNPNPPIIMGVVEVRDKYSIWAYSWPSGDLGKVSKPYLFEVVNDSCKHESVQFGWSNEVGGTDYFTAMGKKSKSLNISKSTFEKILNHQGGLPDYGSNYVGHNDFDRGETIFNTEITDEWKVNTDFITSEEIIDLEYLWSSPEVFVRIENRWYPIIITNNNPIINRDGIGLKNYEITFRLANKKY